MGGADAFDAFKSKLIDEINDLKVEGMPEITSLNALAGHYINLDYRLPNGMIVKFLDDSAMYLGTQIQCVLCNEICFGVVANMDFILICSYEENGDHPELLVYKKR